MPQRKPYRRIDKYWNEKQLLADLIRGGNDIAGRGFFAPMLGSLGDLAGLGENGIRALVGKPQVEPWGGSEHIGRTMQKAGLVSPERRPKTELLASLISPGAAAKTVLNAPKTAVNMLKALDNLDAPATMRNMAQRGAIDLGGAGGNNPPMKRDFRKELADKFKAETGNDISMAGTKLAGVDVRNANRKNLRETFSPYMGKTKAETIANAQNYVDELSYWDGYDLKQAIAGYRNSPFDSLDDEPYPFTPEQMKAFSDWEDYGTRSSNYAYHGTDISSLDGIRQNGLVTNPPTRRQDLSKADKIYLSANQRTAKRYADGYSGKGAVLRVKSSGLKGLLEPDNFEDAAYMYGDNIPPEMLEMKVGKKWVSLAENKGLAKLVAPQDEALRVAQANAALPVEIGDIRPARENLVNLISANTISGRLVGDSMIPIDKLVGGVGREVGDIRRVDDLAAKMSAPNGYLERLIVDDAGNVIEGQHRLDALRKIGVKDVPVTVIRDAGREFPITTVQDAIRAAQKIHPDHVHQISANLAEILADEGWDVSKLLEYEPPRGFEDAWDAGIKALSFPR